MMLFKREHSKTVLYILLAAIIPFLFSFSWLFVNTQLPTSDAANYMSTAIDIYTSYDSDGFWRGIIHSYTIRGWRPIIFPVFLVPFILIFKGNVLLAYSGFILASLFFTVTYLYLYFRSKLTIVASIFAASLICLTPHIQSQLLGFYAESVFFPCIIASIYHLINSDYLRKKSHSIAFAAFMSLALLVRPVEAVLHMCLVIVSFSYIGLSKGVFSKRDLLNACLLMCGGLCLFSVSAKILSHYSHSPIGSLKPIINMLTMVTSLGVLVLGFFVYYLNRSRSTEKSQSYYVYAVLIMTVVNLLWYAPFAYETLSWIYETSFGSVAASTVRIVADNQSAFFELYMHIKSEGNLIVCSTLLLAIFSFLILPINDKAKILTSQWIMYLVLVSVLPILEILYTVQDIIRKTAIAFPALLMMFSLVALWPGRLRNFRLMVYILIVALQTSLTFYRVLIDSTYEYHLNNLVGFYLRAPVSISPNPHNQVAEFIKNEAAILNFNNIDLEVNPYTMDPVDPFLMSVMIRAENRHYQAQLNYFPTYSHENLKELRKLVDAIFLSDNTHNMVISANSAQHYLDKYKKESNPNMKMRYELLYHYSAGSLNAVGWKLADCTTIKSGCLKPPVTQANRSDNCQACILVPA